MQIQTKCVTLQQVFDVLSFYMSLNELYKHIRDFMCLKKEVFILSQDELPNVACVVGGFSGIQCIT